MPQRKLEGQEDPKPKKARKEGAREGAIPETFADPTLDVTFKMLFGNDQHKDVLISLLNSLLGFRDDKQIVEVEINNSELPIAFFSAEKRQSGITSSVDILCTNKGRQKIAIEMQRQKTKYFLSREQEYMAKLISGQVKEGEGESYEVKVLDTYIIVIGKANVFIGNTALKDQKLFELDVQPVVIQTGQVVPHNKMFWKFFELLKFKESANYKGMDKDSPLKEQWLEFLLDCSKQTEEPDRNEIIRKGYDIMKVAKWGADTKALYWKQKAAEQDMIETQEALKQEEFKKGEIKGEIKGKLKGEIKGEISKIKAALKWGVELDKITPELEFLTQNKVKDKLDSNLRYIQEHRDETDSMICDALGVVADMSDFDGLL